MTPGPIRMLGAGPLSAARPTVPLLQRPLLTLAASRARHEAEYAAAHLLALHTVAPGPRTWSREEEAEDLRSGEN